MSMPSYYDRNPATSANAPQIIIESNVQQHFPTEGLYLGKLEGNGIELPALWDLSETKNLCFLYNNENDREKVNRCIERLVWRIALTLPSNLCDLVIYNGGNPGDSFNAHTRINKYLFDERREKIYFDSNVEEFKILINQVYASIVGRMSTIHCAGKKDLYELNTALGKEAILKYQFIFLTDFPRHIPEELANRISQIIAAGTTAGIYIIMSLDMNSDFSNGTDSFNMQQMLSPMELLYPKDNRYYFKNSGHDDSFNKFNFIIDDAAVDTTGSDAYLQQIDILVETAKKASKPAALKQDFNSLEIGEYEPVLNEISVTVGLDIFDKHPVTFRLNSKDYIHGFILGQSGSGKSVLLNNIITSAILKYSPQDLMLYLLDFKGVEFNRYKGVKHTKAVLVDNSDSQMTLEVLRELNDENKKRLKLWDKEGVHSIDEYNSKYPNNRIQQILFVADECQILFKNVVNSFEREIQREISEILNIIATQGRSQGIHMLLATQQLDETDISGQIMKNITECFLLMSAPSDSDRLVPDSSNLTSRQMTGLACYYHKLDLQSQVKTFFATNEELESAIYASQIKAKLLPGNGEHYFCGSALYYLEDNKKSISNSEYDCPISILGQNIGIKAGVTTIPLRKDFFEHILFWGINKEEQTVGVLMNSFISLILSYQQKGIQCDFIAIDCMPPSNKKYQELLQYLASKGLCRLIERSNSGHVFKNLVDDVRNGYATPTILCILGSERFIEIKRNMKLINEVFASISNEENFMYIPDLILDEDENSVSSDMTYPQALLYLLDEGPMQNVHILLQIDKPSNILFGDEYDVNAANKFRHKVILRSENKFLNPFRFSKEIDVENLSGDEQHLRAYYYPDGDDPMLFTPFQIPTNNLIY